MDIHNLALQPVSVEQLDKKYFRNGEDEISQTYNRVSTALTVMEPEWQEVFLFALLNGFIPAGRIQSVAGTDLLATMINCFVEPVGDSLSGYDHHGLPGIHTALAEAGVTMQAGGGVGYNYSPLRPKGALVHSSGSVSSGSISFMEVFDSQCKTLKAAGNRRGAQMAVLYIHHPDIEEFIDAKRVKDRLTQFNMSVGITNEFMHAVVKDEDFELYHEAEPGEEIINQGAYQRDDGMWVYRTIKARYLWDKIMQSTYHHAEPGFLLIDRINEENNLWYCEDIEATNPCGEQPLPPYGCCCLGSSNLTQFVVDPFTPQARFDFDKFARVTSIAVRILDNVLDLTRWPLEKQAEEAANKRRTGQGITGLGSALIMLGIPYNSPEAREMATRILATQRNSAYSASVELAKERGAFPLFDAEKYLQSPYIKRLPQNIRQDIAKYGIRNSHLISIAPTGTISLTFGNNCSNGIEPAFAYHYERKITQPDGSKKTVDVEEYAYMLYRELGYDTNNLPDYFVNAQEISAKDHSAMLEALQPYVDASISKTVNVPEDYPFEDFKDLYIQAWKGGAKGLATFRPNDVTGSILSTKSTDTSKQHPNDIDYDTDRRVLLMDVPEVTKNSLRWPGRPELPNGNPAWTYMVSHPNGADFALFVGHIENGTDYPFEVWVNGAEQPRGLGALAKTLSADMRSQDRAWLKRKLDALIKAKGDDGFMLPTPPTGEKVYMPSLVSAVASLIKHRCTELGAFDDIQDTPVCDALMCQKEPKAGPDGTMSWTVDVLNAATGDDFLLGLKELELPNGDRRPYSMWLSGEYPRVLDGLCKALSMDMQVLDPAWVMLKLKKLVGFPEPQGDFFAPVPGSKKQQVYASTIDYIAQLMIHRYQMLGIVDADGNTIHEVGALEQPVINDNETVVPLHRSVGAMAVSHVKGKLCNECGTHAVIKRDGCDYCTTCHTVGGCG